MVGGHALASMAGQNGVVMLLMSLVMKRLTTC